VRQYTNYRAHSNHSYFTYPCWYAHGRRLAIASDRGNRVNLYGVDLETGGMAQLTDWDPLKAGNRHSLSKNPVREEIYFLYDNTITALDLTTLKSRPLMECPKGYTGNLADATADGRFVCTGFSEDLSGRFQVDLLTDISVQRDMGSATSLDCMEDSPRRRSPANGARGAILARPFQCLAEAPKYHHLLPRGSLEQSGQPHLGARHHQRRAWRIRPTEPGEYVGHEYWMADGEHIGYHGGSAKGALYGSIRYDNSDRVEAPFSGHCWHFHSHMLDLVVGDGDAQEPYLLAWRFKMDNFRDQGTGLAPRFLPHAVPARASDRPQSGAEGALYGRPARLRAGVRRGRPGLRLAPDRAR